MTSFNTRPISYGLTSYLIKQKIQAKILSLHILEMRDKLLTFLSSVYTFLCIKKPDPDPNPNTLMARFTS